MPEAKQVARRADVASTARARVLALAAAAAGSAVGAAAVRGASTWQGEATEAPCAPRGAAGGSSRMEEGLVLTLT